MCIYLPTLNDVQLGFVLGISVTVVFLLPILIRKANEMVVEDAKH